MIVVRIELWPHGNRYQARQLGTARISNDRSSRSRGIGHYKVELTRWGDSGTLWRAGRVEDFPRLRLGPWDLLLWALRATVGERSPGSSIRVLGDGLEHPEVEEDDRDLRWQQSSAPTEAPHVDAAVGAPRRGVDVERRPRTPDDGSGRHSG